MFPIHAPCPTPELPAVADLTAITDALNAVDRPGESARLTLGVGASLPPSPATSQLGLRLDAEASVSWSMDDEGRVQLRAEEGGGGSLEAARGGVSASSGLGSEVSGALIFDDSHQARRWLTAAADQDLSAALEAAPAVEVQASVRRSLGGTLAAQPDIELGAGAVRRRTYTALADDGLRVARADSYERRLALALPWRGVDVDADYTWQRSTGDDGSASLQHELTLSLPAELLAATDGGDLEAALGELLAGAAEVPAELTGAGLAADVAEAVRGHLDGTAAGLDVSLVWERGLDPTGEQTWRRRRIYLTHRGSAAAGGLAIERRELVHERLGWGPVNE